MPNIKISDLSNVTPSGYTPNDLLVIVNYNGNPTGVTRNTKISDVKDYVLSGLTFSGQTLIEVTHSELVDKVSGGTLIPGSFYKITDYQTKYRIIAKQSNEYNEQYKSVDPNEQTGPIEPLIVLALSNSEIDKKAYSETYPQDIIFYELYDPFSEFGRPLTYNITFGNSIPLYFSGTTQYFDVFDPYDGFQIGNMTVTFDNSFNITSIIFNYPYFKKDYTYKFLINYLGFYGTITPLSIETFGGDKGYITKRIDTKNSISVQGDWRVIKYRRWSVELLKTQPISGTFYCGEKVIGDISGRAILTSAELYYPSIDDNFYIKRNNNPYGNNDTFGNKFQVGEIITGEKSGAQAVITSIEVDEYYDWGKHSTPHKPGEVYDIYYNFEYGTPLPIPGYSSQTISFTQSSTTGIGTGFTIDITFDYLGNISSYSITNNGENYLNSDIITTNDGGFGSINLLVSNIQGCELFAGVNVYVVSGTALYNGTQYNSGETFTPLIDPYQSLNPLEYFQQVGSTPLLVKKPYYGVCFDNGLPYKDLTLFSEEYLKLGRVGNVNFGNVGSWDFWIFQGKVYERELTYLGTVIIHRAINIDTGPMIDCSAPSLRGPRSLDSSSSGIIFDTVFGWRDGGGGKFNYVGNLCCNILCHAANFGTTNFGRLSGLITTDNVSLADVNISSCYNVTFGHTINGYSMIENTNFNISETFYEWFSIDSIIGCDFNIIYLYNWFSSGQIRNSTFKGPNISDITINNNFTNNKLNFSSDFIDNIFWGETNNNNITCTAFSRNRITGNTYDNVITCETFKDNEIYSNYYNNILNLYSFKSNKTYDSFRYNTIKTDIDSTDFSTATHVYGDYNCEIFKNSSGNPRLSYYDASDVLTITDITS